MVVILQSIVAIAQTPVRGGSPINIVYESAAADGGRAKQYLDIFRKAMNQVEFKSDQLDYDNKRSGSKLINSIRNTYTKAKGKVAKNDKSDMPRDVEIIIHSQEDGDCPPLTDELRFYYDEYPNQLESANSSIYYHCYFLIFPWNFRFILFWTQAYNFIIWHFKLLIMSESLVVNGELSFTTNKYKLLWNGQFTIHISLFYCNLN